VASRAIGFGMTVGSRSGAAALVEPRMEMPAEGRITFESPREKLDEFLDERREHPESGDRFAGGGRRRA
jgi:hypothetical protein